MEVKLIGSTGSSIAAIVVAITMSSGIAQNNTEVINMAYRMFCGLLLVLFGMAALINIPKIRR